MKNAALLSLAASLLLSACATVTVRPLPAETPAPEELRQQLILKHSAVEGLKGLAQMQVSAPGNRFSAQQVFFVRRPASLRVEALSPLGTPQLTLVTDGRDLSIYSPGDNRYYRGQAATGRLSSVLPVNLTTEEAVALLLGGVPILSQGTAELQADPREGLWILHLLSPDRQQRQTLWILPHSLSILRAQFTRPGASGQIIFSEFRDEGGLRFPGRMQWTSEVPPSRVSVVYEDLQINPTWDPQDFHLPVPRGAAVLPLP